MDMEFTYFALVMLPFKEGRWGKQSEALDVPFRVYSWNLDEFRSYVEQQFTSMYPNAEGATLEAYKLIGMRCRLVSEEDATRVSELLNELGHPTRQAGMEVVVDLND